MRVSIAVLLFLLLLAEASKAQKMVVSVEMGVGRTKDISGTWRYWHNNRHNPAQIDEHGRRNLASVDYPLIGMYDDSDTAAIEYKYQLLKMCGIDAISFYATADCMDDPWFVEKQRTNFRYMKKYGLKALPRYQGADTNQMSRLFKLFDNELLLRINGRPVFSFFNVTMDSHTLEAWNRSQSPYNGRVFLMRRLYTDSRRLSKFDGVYDWVGDGRDKARDTTRTPYIWYYTEKQIKQAYHHDIAKADSLIKTGDINFYAEGISPGFNDIKVNGWGKGPRFIERGNGRVYAYKWKQAVKNQFEMVMIPTWDDWSEGTTIAPTVEYGIRYLRMTRKYVAEYKKTDIKKGNLMLPVWIYRLRKSNHGKEAAEITRRASSLIQQERFLEAERLVKPLLADSNIEKIKYWDKAISVSDFEITQTVQKGEPGALQRFTIRKTGFSELNYTVSVDRDWLTVSKESGVLGDNEEDQVNVNYYTSELKKGNYRATITVSDPSSCNKIVPIKVNLQVR